MEGLQVESAEVSVTKDGAVSIPVPEGFTPTPPAAEAPAFTGQPGNIMSDLAALAAEKAPTETKPVTQEPEQPAATATAPETPVPDKFRNPDGTLNEERLAKSKAAALAEYHRIERELKQAQNQLHQVKTQPAAPPVQTPTQLTPLERSMAEDLIREAAAFGQQLPEWQAIAQARVMARGLEAKHSADLAVTEDVRTRLDDYEREKQLSAIADVDPWVFSPEGIKTLTEVRRSYPHVNAAKEPWQAAYDQHLANEAKKLRLSGQVQTPTPSARTVKAPPTPVQAAPRAVVKPVEPDMSNWSKDQINAYVDGLSPKEQQAFYAKRGLRL